MIEFLKSNRFHFAILIISAMVLGTVAALLVPRIPSTITRDGITLLPPTVPVPITTSSTVINMLAIDAAQRGIYTYAITDTARLENGSLAVSVAGLPENAPKNWSLEDCSWLAVITINRDSPNTMRELQPPSAPLPYLDPTINMGTGGSGDILPFYRGTQAQYGIAGVHNCGYGLTGWSAVDLFPSDNTVYAAADGDVSYVCRDGTQMSIRVGNFMYAHLVDNGIQTGTHINQGQQLSTLVRGTFSATCGNASQNPAYGHVHWCFVPESGNQFTADGYTLNLSSGNWQKGSDTVAPLGYLTASWAGANITPSSPVGANFWDGLMDGVMTMITASLPGLPDHELMDLPQRVISIAAIPLDLVYSMILINFRMDTVIWVFGIIMAMESIRILYAGYMWIKRAIPVVG